MVYRTVGQMIELEAAMLLIPMLVARRDECRSLLSDTGGVRRSARIYFRPHLPAARPYSICAGRLYDSCACVARAVGHRRASVCHFE